MRIGADVWYANRINPLDETIPVYEEPKKITTRANYFTVMPSSSRGYLEVLKQGESVYSTWIAIANSRIFSGVFKEGGVFWVDGEKPDPLIEEQYGNGSSANAQIKHVAEQNLTIAITLQTNQMRVLE